MKRKKGGGSENEKGKNERLNEIRKNKRLKGRGGKEREHTMRQGERRERPAPQVDYGGRNHFRPS